MDIKEKGWRDRFDREFMEYASENGNNLIDADTDGDVLKNFIEQTIKEERERIVEFIDKQITIHSHLAKEWTGIDLLNRTQHRINPHKEKVEELQNIINLIKDDE